MKRRQRGLGLSASSDLSQVMGQTEVYDADHLNENSFHSFKLVLYVLSAVLHLVDVVTIVDVGKESFSAMKFLIVHFLLWLQVGSVQENLQLN